jgi:PAS domain S-box-containing protein
MADTAPVLLWIANAVGRCTFFNKPWLSFTGRGMEQEVGDGWMDGIHPEDRDRCAAIYREALRTEDRFSMEYRLRRADGVYRWVLHTGVPRFTPHGMPAGFIGSVLDVTPLKDLEIERTRLLANEQAARLDAEAANRAKDEFLAVLSHELRTPLNAMVGWLRLLRMGSLDSRKAQRALETIERNTYTQARLIDDLLDVSRIVTGKIKLELRSVDMGALVRATVDAMGPPAQDKGVELQAEVDPTIGAILGDQFRLQQVLGNLLSNAIKFTPVGGTVRVRLHRVESGVEMVVADTGKGIAPHLLPHVFDRFRQGDTTSTRAQGGLGLGLAIARHLVELHGGTIRADSAGADRGTTMLVSLPLPASALEPTGPGFTHPRYETLRLQPAELTGVHVLVVDDDVDACDLLSVVLQGWGAHVTTATSAAEAFALFGKERPDVVVSDIGMPDEDGYSLIRRLRATEPEDRRVPAIAVSALVSDEHRAHALAAGFDRHLPKPVQITDLLQVVSEFAPARSTMS